MDLAKAAPTVPDCQAAAAAAAPPARPAAYNTTLDHAPFETMEKYYPCPQAGISRSLMTGDVKGAQVYRTIRDPLDPMCLNKPYPGVWLEGIVDKSQKPSRTLQTNRQTSPLDPNYILPSGPSIMPSGEKKFSDRTFNMMLATDDICGAKPQPLYNKPCRCLHEGDPVEEIKGSKPKNGLGCGNWIIGDTTMTCGILISGRSSLGLFERESPIHWSLYTQQSLWRLMT